MILVISQAWTKPGDDHAAGYMSLSEEFGRFWADHPGFRGRQLVRGVEDPTHFTHLRWFDSIASYEECTQSPGYVDHTVAMYEHLQPYDSYPREYADVVLEQAPSADTRWLRP